MNTFRTLFDVPARIRQLERFGVGTFSDAHTEAKCRHIRKIMEKRAPLLGHQGFRS